MPARPIPTRHWRSYGDDPLPTGREALAEPFRAFPSWFMLRPRRQGPETHFKRGDMLIRDIIARMRHDGCGGRAGRDAGEQFHHCQQPAGAAARPGR